MCIDVPTRNESPLASGGEPASSARLAHPRVCRPWSRTPGHAPVRVGRPRPPVRSSRGLAAAGRRSTNTKNNERKRSEVGSPVTSDFAFRYSFLVWTAGRVG